MFLAPDNQAEKARNLRRAFAIHFYDGKNGSGKSLTAVYDTLPTLEEGRPVLSTVRLVDYLDPTPCDGFQHGPNVIGEPSDLCPITHPHTGEHIEDGHGQSHPYYIRFTNWSQLLNFQRGDVLMDEITGVADSADHAGLPTEVRNKLPQLRRADVAIRITGLSWSRLNKRLREACMAVTRCRGLLPVAANTDFGRDRIFRPKRMSVAATYDCLDLPTDDITEHAFSEATALRRGRLWIPGCEAIRAYDTFSPVDSVGWVDLSGTCGYCGGSRSRPKCQCSDYLAEIEGRKNRVAVDPSGAGSDDTGSSVLTLTELEQHESMAETCSDLTACACDTLAPSSHTPLIHPVG